MKPSGGNIYTVSSNRGNTTHLFTEETLPIFSQRKHHPSSPRGNTTHLFTEETPLIFSQRKYYSSFDRGNTTHLLTEETLLIFSQRKHYPSFERGNTTHLLTEETPPIFSQSKHYPSSNRGNTTHRIQQIMGSSHRPGNPPDAGESTRHLYWHVRRACWAEWSRTPTTRFCLATSLQGDNDPTSP